MSTTLTELNNKYCYIPNIIDGFNCDAFNRKDASLFKILEISELTDQAAYIITIQHLAGNVDKLFGEYLGNTEKGSLYRCSYKTISQIKPESLYSSLTDIF